MQIRQLKSARNVLLVVPSAMELESLFAPNAKLPHLMYLTIKSSTSTFVIQLVPLDNIPTDCFWLANTAMYPVLPVILQLLIAKLVLTSVAFLISISTANAFSLVLMVTTVNSATTPAFFVLPDARSALQATTSAVLNAKL